MKDKTQDKVTKPQNKMNTIRFTKMHGAGNDYVYVNAMEQDIANPEEKAIRWSDRHKGIGSDGLILICPSTVADCRMRMFNADGSEGRMCGNGVRCVAKYVVDNGIVKGDEVSVETLAGIKNVKVWKDAEGHVYKARVDMGRPVLDDDDLFHSPPLGWHNMRYWLGIYPIPGNFAVLESPIDSYAGYFVSMGNPHFVIFVDDINKVDLEKEGPALETLDAFPQRCNIEFAQHLGQGVFRTRVWERGSGITQACGTGACATAVAAVISHKVDDHAIIRMDGGDLEIDWNGVDSVFLTGPAQTVFEGEIEDKECERNNRIIELIRPIIPISPKKKY